jgi:hypothetical protein
MADEQSPNVHHDHYTAELHRLVSSLSVIVGRAQLLERRLRKHYPDPPEDHHDANATLHQSTRDASRIVRDLATVTMFSKN